LGGRGHGQRFNAEPQGERKGMMGKRGWRVVSAFALTLTMVWAAAAPAGAVTVPVPPVGDAPVLIPGTEFPDTDEDEGGSQVAINDDYILSRTAGDDPLSVETAAAARAAGVDKAKQIQKLLQGSTATNATFAGTWGAIGPSPIIQIQRSDGALANVSGRIGA